MARGKVKRVGGSAGRVGFGRALTLLAFLPIASRVPMYTRLISVARDGRADADAAQGACLPGPRATSSSVVT